MSITFSAYQQAAARTMAPPSRDSRLEVALGLAGEVGETIDLLKKHECHGHILDRAKLAEELGDILWYVSAVATSYEIDLCKAAVNNIGKLRLRYPDGFSEAASINRAT